jgi:hypothetical protein
MLLTMCWTTELGCEFAEQHFHQCSRIQSTTPSRMPFINDLYYMLWICALDAQLMAMHRGGPRV